MSSQGRMLGTGGFYGAASRIAGAMQYEAPYGNSLVGAYALAARRGAPAADGRSGLHDVLGGGGPR